MRRLWRSYERQWDGFPAPRFSAAAMLVLFGATGVFTAVSSASDLGVPGGLAVGASIFVIALTLELCVVRLERFLARDDDRWKARAAKAQGRRADRQQGSASL
jgi:hypothetical protein